jgi:hypothetical protein
MPFDVDTAYAPELLIFRLTEWPSVDEQVQLHGRLTARGLLTENTVALIDVRSADMVPTDAMIQAVAATLKGTGGPQRRAYVVSTQEQAKFIVAVRLQAPPILEMRAFFTEKEAMAWLFPTAREFPLAFLD